MELNIVTDYTTTALCGRSPKAGELEAGDILTADQAYAALCDLRLADYGLSLNRRHDDTYIVMRTALDPSQATNPPK